MCVSVGSASYGLPLENVQEVIGVRAVTRVFHAPSALAGIINLRGEVLPILDLPVLLGSVAQAARLSDARIVVVREVTGLKRRAGLRVDALLGLLDIPLSGLAAGAKLDCACSSQPSARRHSRLHPRARCSRSRACSALPSFLR